MFLNEIQISSHGFPRHAEQITTLIEPDFSNTGFGHPDAIIRLDNSSQSAVLIVEAKRSIYAKACKPSSFRGAQGFNSTLNGQLELDYVLGVALSNYRDGHNELIEPEWILSTPYSQERRGTVRCLKNPAVLRDVVAHFAGLSLENYFYVVVTNDDSDPFSACQKEFLPELYHPNHGFTNCWQQMKPQFGWINYGSLENIVRNLKDKGHLSRESFFLESAAINRRNMGRSDSPLVTASEPEITSEYTKPGFLTDGRICPASTRGVSLIFAPKLSSRTFLHFSWRGESCAIRDYSSGPSYSPLPQRGHRTSHVRPLIEREVAVPGREAIEDSTFWHAKIIELNRQFLGVATQPKA